MANKSNNTRKKGTTKKNTTKKTASKTNNMRKKSYESEIQKEIKKSNTRIERNSVKKINENISNNDSNTSNKKTYDVESKLIPLETTTEAFDISKIVKVSIIVAITFMTFYVLTLGIKKWQNSKNNVSANTKINKIQYDEILMSKILKQDLDDYYVLVIGKDDDDESSYMKYINQLKETKVYTVDLDSAFNRDFYGEESNLVVENISDLKVKESSLLHVENHAITEGFEGNNEILDKLITTLK